MKIFTLLLALLCSVPVFADAGIDAGDDAGVLITVDAPVVVQVDAGPPPSLVVMAKADQLAVDTDAGIQSPLPANEAAIVREIFVAIKSGNWWLAGTALLLLVVGVLRKFGKKWHLWLNQFGSGAWFYVNKPLWFLFDTKIGGWLLNWMTAIAGGLGTAWAAGSKIDHSIVKSVVMVSTSATMLIELYDDVKEWWDKKKAKKAAESPAVPQPPLPQPPVV